MRLLSFLLGLLILANVVLLAWPQKKESAPHLSQIQDEVNPHFIRLNKEIETRFYSQIREPIEITIDPISTSPQEVSQNQQASELPDTAATISAEDEVCYRVGPFTHKPNYELAQAVLFNASIEYKQSRRESRESMVTRLYLGPFKRKEQVDDKRVLLRQAGVLDHFVRKQDDDFIISLGIYSSDESADTALRLFEDKLDRVKRREEKVVLPESYWLHFELADDQSVKRQLSAMDWGEPSAKMGLFDCLSG